MSSDPHVVSPQGSAPRAVQADTHVIRFRLLADLCFKLGQNGCASHLLYPSAGGPVLYVLRPGGRERLGVGAVEHRPGWAYTWGGRWTPAADSDLLVTEIVRMVRS